MTKSSLGIDVSKDTLDAALLLPGQDKPTTKIFDNSPAGFRNLVAWLQARAGNDLHVCMESTGVYHYDLACHLVAAEFTVSVVNPARIKAYASSEMVRNKADRADAPGRSAKQIHFCSQEWIHGLRRREHCAAQRGGHPRKE